MQQSQEALAYLAGRAAGNPIVVTAVLGEQPHVDVIRDAGDPVDPLGGLLGLPLLPEAADRAAKGDGAVVAGGHHDRLGVDPRVPEQLLGEVAFQRCVGHRLILLRTDEPIQASRAGVAPSDRAVA
jgi:hypothetical protein